MFAILITWVALGNMRFVAVQTPAPLVACQAARAEAVRDSDTVMAAACVTDGAMVAEALRIGDCRLYPEVSTPTTRLYYCNGRMPQWN